MKLKYLFILSMKFYHHNSFQLQQILKCVQNQFGTEQQRAVIDSLDGIDNGSSDYLIRDQIEQKLIEDGGLFGFSP